MNAQNKTITVPRDEKGKIMTLAFAQKIAESQLFKSNGVSLFRVNTVWRFCEQINSINQFILLVKNELIDPEQANAVPRKIFEEVHDELIVNTAIHFEPDSLIHPDFLNLKNGVLNIRKLEFVPDDQANSMFFRYYLDIEYQEDVSTLPENMQNFVDTSVNKDDYDAFLEAVGYIVSDLRVKRKAVLFLGKSGSGKSTISNLIKSVIFPKSVVTNYFLRQISNQFSTANVLSSKINIADELDVTKRNCWEDFKSIVSGADMNGSKKYHDDLVLKAQTKLLFCGNRLPDPKGLDPEPIFDRLLIVNFTGKIDAQHRNENLLEELNSEKNAIFSLCIKKLNQALSNGFSETTVVKAILRQVSEENESIETFIENMLEFSEKATIYTSDLNEAYRKYCKDNCWKTLSSHDLYRALYAKGATKASGRINRGPNKQRFLGVQIKAEQNNGDF